MKKNLLFLAIIIALPNYAQKVYKVYQDCSQTFNEDLTQPTGTENGREWVDLGLSVKWATMNVGASSDCEYGSYTGLNASLCNISIIPLSADYARQTWGGKWRIPSKVEMEELINNCNSTQLICQNGIQGIKLTSKINGKSIFLPYAGYNPGSTYFDTEKGTRGYYLSTDFSTNSLNSSYYYSGGYLVYSYMLYLATGSISIITKAWGIRYDTSQINTYNSGFTVRAVCD